MISFFLLTLVYGSNAVSKLLQEDVGLNPIMDSTLKIGNSTLKPQSFLETIKADPKKFVAEVQNLDPVALANIISLLEELLTSSEARETDLVNNLQDANDALDTANTDVLNALDALTAAEGRTAAANTAVTLANNEQEAAEAHEAAVQEDLEQKRQVHSEKQTEQGTAEQTAHDEIQGLNAEQQVLRDVIAMLKGLLGGGEATGLDEEFPIIAGAKWEYTSDWDCGGNDLGHQSAVPWDGSESAIESRVACAQKCLDNPNCVAFNSPNIPTTCYWKHSYQKSTELGTDCGNPTENWQYYTLLDKNP